MQSGGNVLLADAPEGKPLAAGENGCRDLVQLCCGKNKEQMLRGLLNDFQQGVECGQGQHMHLVHDIHPLTNLGRGIDRIVPQIPDVVHAVIGCGIDFQHIHTGPGINGPAGLALIAGVAVIRVQTVDRLCQNFGAAGLARAPGACKKVSMAQLAGDHLGFQGLGHCQLPRHIVKGLRAIFSI